jgi:hypothetical protein
MQCLVPPPSPAKARDPSLPETLVLEPQRRGVLDTPLSRRMTAVPEGPADQLNRNEQKHSEQKHSEQKHSEQKHNKQK